MLVLVYRFASNILNSGFFYHLGFQRMNPYSSKVNSSMFLHTTNINKAWENPI